MKRIKGSWILILITLILSVSLLTGCVEEKSGSTISEPKITADYLTDEYADQLLTDGAQTMTGFITLEEKNGSYIVHITEKEVVPNSNYEEGYYLADTNVTSEAYLGFDARMTYMNDGKIEVIKAKDFAQNKDIDPNQLYTIYIMVDSAELILAVDPESIIEK